MSQWPPEYGYGSSPAPEQRGPAENNASKLVHLAVIFNYISVGVDGLGFLGGVGMGILILAMGPEIARQQPNDVSPALAAAVYVAAGCAMAVLGVVKLIAARKLQKGGPGAWGWGLAAGIMGCCELCPFCLCVQPAAGVYTVVILCFQKVKTYLDSGQG
jgi:hypothetical protein